MTSLHSVLIGIVRQDSCCSIDLHLRVLDVHWLGHALTVLAAFKTMAVLHIAGWYIHICIHAKATELLNTGQDVVV